MASLAAITLWTGVWAQEARKPDSPEGVIRSQRQANGVPLGGIGAGTFQLMSDGTVSRAILTNSWSTDRRPACLLRRVMDENGRQTTARVLALRSPYGLPVARSLDFEGLPPQAALNFPDPALPLGVSLRAFSPLIPFDLRNSSFPAAAFIFRLRNRSPCLWR